MNPGSGQAGTRRVSLLHTAIAANIGMVFEWFDLLIYALFAVTLSMQFFPSNDPNSAVLLSLGTFAIAWLVRPIGAVVLGTYADRVGRKPALVWSVSLMMLGTGITTVLPNYATIGVAAPLRWCSRGWCRASPPAVSSAAPPRRWSSRTPTAAASWPAGSVSARASKYSGFDEGEMFQAACNTLRTVAVRRRKWNLR